MLKRLPTAFFFFAMGTEQQKWPLIRKSLSGDLHGGNISLLSVCTLSSGPSMGILKGLSSVSHFMSHLSFVVWIQSVHADVFSSSLVCM